MEKQEKGKFGEDLACGYLVKKGYKILRRNARSKWGELDIVAKSKDQTLVFIEVKAMTGMGAEGLKPEDQMTSAKLKKFKRAAEMFAAKNPDLIDEKRGWRLDLVAIDLDITGELTCPEPVCPEPVEWVERGIRHYENI